MSRRIYGTIAAIIMLLSFSACSEEQAPATSQETADQRPAPTTQVSLNEQQPGVQPTTTLPRIQFKPTATTPPPFQPVQDGPAPTNAPQPTPTPVTTDWSDNSAAQNDPHARAHPR